MGVNKAAPPGSIPACSVSFDPGTPYQVRTEAICVVAGIAFVARLSCLMKIIRSIYRAMGIIPQVAALSGREYKKPLWFHGGFPVCKNI
ncbi:MAG TPA: hypothetical protein PLD91_00005 [Spirochaetota bacterium]|nr:hypothetical protein [Spirochaetota bacterium]